MKSPLAIYQEHLDRGELAYQGGALVEPSTP